MDFQTGTDYRTGVNPTKRRVYTNIARTESDPPQTRFYETQAYAQDNTSGTSASNSFETQTPQPDSAETWRATQDARAFFLVKRYEGASTVEDDARFHQLTERLRRLNPRVTAGHIALLDESVSVLENAGSELDGILAEIDSL